MPQDKTKIDDMSAEQLKRFYEYLDHKVQDVYFSGEYGIDAMGYDRGELVMDGIFEALDKAVKSDKNDASSLDATSSLLGRIVYDYTVDRYDSKYVPNGIEKGALSVLDTISKSDKHDAESLHTSYLLTELILYREPELAKEALPVVETMLKSDKNNADSLSMGYLALRCIAGADLELAGQVLSDVRKNITSEKNDANSLKEAYATLGFIASEDYDQNHYSSLDVRPILEEGLKSDKNDKESTNEGKAVIERIEEMEINYAEIRRREEIEEQQEMYLEMMRYQHDRD